MTGVSAIQYYSPVIFAQIGISTSDTLKYQGISSGLALIAQATCIALIDRTGRRWAMIGGNLANCLFFIIATVMLAVFPPGSTSNASASWAFIVVTWLYNISFSATNGPLSCVMVSFAFNTMIGQVTPIAMAKIGWRFYVVFVVCNFTNAVYFWATQPETKKRPMEEMNYLFTNAPWFVPTMSMKEYEIHDLEHRVEEVERKGSITRHAEL
ncbi:hypothetical protein LTR29_017413 [Friedmanniomyces endolithicus]|nr:hypothetical protein LTR29_017413 [Friedmanniomyces endolithicus]